jgi:phosphoglycolate phosphatase
MLEKYEHIIWDWNGTLLDDVSLCISIINGMLKKRDMNEIDSGKYRQILDFPIINYYLALGFNFKKESFKNIASEFITEYKERLHESGLQAGAVSFLDTVQDYGIQQSVLSASEQNQLLKATNHFDIDTYFNKLSGLNHTYASGKLELGIEHIKDLGLNPAKTLLIGDTTHDYEVGIQLGCDVLLVTFGHQSKSRFNSCNCGVIDSFQDISGKMNLRNASSL